MKTWKRADGVTVTYKEGGDVPQVLLFRPDQSTLIQKTYGWWEQWEAAETAQELADLLGCELVLPGGNDGAVAEGNQEVAHAA